MPTLPPCSDKTASVRLRGRPSALTTTPQYADEEVSARLRRRCCQSRGRRQHQTCGLIARSACWQAAVRLHEIRLRQQTWVMNWMGSGTGRDTPGTWPNMTATSKYTSVTSKHICLAGDLDTGVNSSAVASQQFCCIKQEASVHPSPSRQVLGAVFVGV